MVDMMLVNARFRWSNCQLVSINWGNSLAPNAVNYYLTKCWPTSEEYLHHHAIFAGHVSQTATSVTEISYPYIIQQEGCSGLATDSFCGVWGYGWTTCLQCGGPLLDLCFQTTMVCKFDIMEINFLLSYTFIIVFMNYKSFTYHFPHIWFYSEIVLCTVISHRRSLYSFLLYHAAKQEHTNINRIILKQWACTHAGVRTLPPFAVP